jgi:hypothetical protein
MKLLFFPTMGLRTGLEALTAFFITCYKSPALPIFTKFYVIFEKIRFSSEILKIVSVYTLSFIMFMIMRAPLSFEVKDIKIIILLLRLLKNVMD